MAVHSDGYTLRGHPGGARDKFVDFVAGGVGVRDVDAVALYGRVNGAVKAAKARSARMVKCIVKSRGKILEMRRDDGETVLVSLLTRS